MTDLHRVLHTATLSAVAVHFDKTWPGGGERPASSQVSRGKFTGQHIQIFKLFYHKLLLLLLLLYYYYYYMYHVKV